VVVVSPALLTLAPAVVLRRLLGYHLGAVVQDLYGAALAEVGTGGAVPARLTARLERSLLRRVDGIVVIHDVFKQKLLAGGLSADRIEVIPNWAHVSMSKTHDREGTRSVLGWGEDEFIALHAGNMGAKQGLEGLIDVGRLAEQRGSAVRIVLMGSGSRHEALTEYAGESAHVTFSSALPAGAFEDALAAADCLVLHEKPGVVEMSVPSKLTSYFASGRPVVAATDPRSGAASLMRAAIAGPTVRAGDASAILDAIEHLARNTDVGQEFGKNGRRYAAENLSGAASLSRMDAWIKHLADADVRRPSAEPAGRRSRVDAP
jgi:colanic acid biosynthesis glycosyl transferase WcaI